MMNPSDALPASHPADSHPDTPLALPEHPTLALPEHPTLALPEHPTEPGLIPVEDVALENEVSDQSVLENAALKNVVSDQMPALPRSDEDRTRISLLAETLGVEKAWQSAGYVVISRRTVEEQVHVPVTLRHEEITMTRHFRDPNAPDAAPEGVTLSPEFGEAYGEGTLVMRLHEEIPQVLKVVRVAEEVEFARRIVSEETRKIGSVRREELDVKAPQNATVSGAEVLPS